MKDETNFFIPPLSHLPEAKSHFLPYVSPAVPPPFSPFFFAAFSRVRSPLNSPLLPSSSSLARALVIYLGTTFASIPIQPEYSPATLFFLTFPRARPRRQRRRRENAVPASLSARFLRTTIERYHREFTSQNTTVESYQR